MKRGAVIYLLTFASLSLCVAGCGKASSNGDAAAFKVYGSFNSIHSSAIVIDGKTVTDVIAICPSNHEQRLGTVGSGNFTIDIDRERPWIIVFVDRSRVGLDMIVGKFRSGVLDTLRPSLGTTSTDLGTIVFDPATSTRSATAECTIGFDALLTAIGMSSATATFFGAMDDISLRYVNPDKNNNGVLDVVEGLTDVRLDFHNRYQPRVSGTPVTLTAIRNAFLPDNTAFNYTQTGVTFEIARSAFSLPSSYEFRFSNTATLADSSSLSASTFYPQSYIDNPLYERYQLGIETLQPPSGQYDVRVGPTTFTFSDVVVPGLAVREGFILPFVRFNVRDDETVSGISWKWMKKSGSVWVEASAAEVDIVVSDDGGNLGLYIDGDNLTSNKTISWTLPKTVSGTLSMSTARLEHLSASEATAMTFGRMGHVGLSYDDTLGMRYFAF